MAHDKVGAQVQMVPKYPTEVISLLVDLCVECSRPNSLDWMFERLYNTPNIYFGALKLCELL